MSDNKPTFTTCIRAQDALYEMVLDPQTKATSFISIDRSGNVKTGLRELQLDGETYIPINGKSNLLACNVVLFPSRLEDYGSEKQLLGEIKDFIHKYLDVSPVYEKIATYYILFTWLYEKFNDIPYLRAMGDYGSGKSRFLQTIGNICYKPMFMGGATTSSPLFRIMNEFKGTLIIDEADLRFSDMTNDMVKILNTGYQKGVPLLRTEGKGVFEVKSFDVFCPKIVGTREKFTDTALESRFLIEEMGERKLRDGIPRSLDENFYRESLNLRNKLLSWRMNNYFSNIDLSTDLVENVHPRLQQITLPLFSIIKDQSARDDLTVFITRYNDRLLEERDMSWESDIIAALLKLEKRTNKAEVTVGEITDEVNKGYEERDKMTPRKVGGCLKKKLNMRTRRSNKGFLFNYSLNKSKIYMWKDRYGITDESLQDVNVVNDVNDVNANKELDYDDIPVINPSV